MKLALLALMVAPSFTPKSEILQYRCPEDARAPLCEEASNCPVLRVSPAFPYSCAVDKAGEAKVVARLVVLRNGQVESGKVVESTNPCFNGPTLKNFCRFRYAPAEMDRAEIETMFFKYEDRPEEEPHE